MIRLETQRVKSAEPVNVVNGLVLFCPPCASSPSTAAATAGLDQDLMAFYSWEGTPLARLGAICHREAAQH